jgi:hypothetical protein
MQESFSRPEKLTDAQTILYEIDMVRFAASRLIRKKWETEKDEWVYLECFLLHCRNLIEFLGDLGAGRGPLFISAMQPKASILYLM